MATYRVGFDGKWQGDFDNEAEAIAWATEVGETGRVAFVVKFEAPFRRELVAIFPEERREVGEELWRVPGPGWPGGGTGAV
jgi:hypothetical protein